MRILVAEDNDVSRYILVEMLSNLGHDPVPCVNGREAMERFRQEYFPVVITDWLMPEMDGLELCRNIRETSFDRYTYLIILTTQDSKEELIGGLDTGADEYIIKPLCAAELRVRLKTAHRILELETSLKKSLAEIHELSIRDPLTGAFNRGYLDQQILHEIRRAYRYSHTLTIIMCDLDHFKNVNDVYGHQAGDDVLKFTVSTIFRSIRKDIDWVARYGGEEFLIVLPETDQPGSMVVMERMRHTIANSQLTVLDHEIAITASFGAVTLVPGTGIASIEELLNIADRALYHSKHSGRNRCSSALHPQETDACKEEVKWLSSP